MNRHIPKHDTKDRGITTAGIALGGTALLAVVTVTCMGRVEETLQSRLEFDRQIVADSGDTPIDLAQENCKDHTKIAAAVMWIENNNTLPILPKQAVNLPNC